MNKLGSAVVGLGVVSLVLAGCTASDAGRPSESDEPTPVSLAGDPHVDADDPIAQASDVRIRLEKSRRSLDRGDAASAKADLESLANDASISGDERNDVLLALSRAYELDGDDEAAIEMLESILIANTGREQYDAHEPAEKRLRFLLTGNEDETALRLPANDKLAPVTFTLAELFTPAADGHVLVDVFAFGRRNNQSHGIFEIAEAKRSELEKELGSNVKVFQSISSTGSWISLPRAMGETRDDMPQADRSLLVFYYDLADNRVPSRYDAYLPMPSEEIAAILEQGNGVIAARKREGGKPVFVIAAPRQAQLELVEEVFSEMTEIPYEPVVVPLKRNLRPGEIQAVVRQNFNKARACYEAALKRDKTMAGKLMLDFAIDGMGNVLSPKLGPETTLLDEELDACVLDVVAKLKFTATGEKTPITVKYPIVMSP